MVSTFFSFQGTEFMDNLAKCLRYYIADRLNNDPGWKSVTVRQRLHALLLYFQIKCPFLNTSPSFNLDPGLPV